VATWLSMIVAARLLAPGDFGLLGMPQVFLGLVTMLSEFGLATAIIAQPSIDDEQVGQLNSLALLVGAGAVAVTCTAARPLGSFFDTPELPMVVAATSSVFVISGLRAVLGALLQKELKFRYVALAESAQALAGAVTMVVLSVWGFRYWALVFAPVVGNLESLAGVGGSPQKGVTLLEVRLGDSAAVVRHRYSGMLRASARRALGPGIVQTVRRWLGHP